MNVVSALKKKMKNKKLAFSASVGAASVAVASSASAAVDYTPVQTLIDTAVADVVAGGLILLGAYAGFWGIKKVKSLLLTVRL